ncbi:MAG: RNA polymerase sigma factor [Hungatella sp.]|uniref:RNA polymerase sigma factor n=1 Tax=Hungatella sp. TaxID=2613924 RepID=UPI00399066C7
MGVRFEEVYQRQKNAVYGYLSYMTKDKDTAEDLAQETFLKVYLGLKGFKEDCSEKTWCLTIARNTFLSFARKKQPVLLEEADMERLGAGYEADRRRSFEGREGKTDPGGAFFLKCRRQDDHPASRL